MGTRQTEKMERATDMTGWGEHRPDQDNQDSKGNKKFRTRNTND